MWLVISLISKRPEKLSHGIRLLSDSDPAGWWTALWARTLIFRLCVVVIIYNPLLPSAGSFGPLLWARSHSNTVFPKRWRTLKITWGDFKIPDVQVVHEYITMSRGGGQSSVFLKGVKVITICSSLRTSGPVFSSVMT